MADKNFNQGQQSQHDWDRDKDKDRSNQGNDWSSQNSGGRQNRDINQGYRDVGYSGDSARGMDHGNQGWGNRANYIPDNDDNRDFGNRDYNNTQAGSSGAQGYRASGMDYNSGGYHSENRGSFGNTGFGNDYGNQDRNRNSGNQYGNDNDRNRGQMNQNTGGSWSSDHGWQGRNRSNMNYGGNDNQHDYGNRGHGGGYGNMGNDYGRGDQDRTWNRYGGDTSNRGNANQGGVDNNWWEKTRDKVTSWFSGDDNNDDRGRRDHSGGHRGKGPSDYRRSQDRVREDICDRLTDDDRVDASNIRVQMEDDVVILTGTVNSRDEKRRAEDLVESVSGVQNVENRLRVGSASLASHNYTGNTDNVGGIGNQSGTTNEVIRNVQNERESGTTRTGKPENT